MLLEHGECYAYVYSRLCIILIPHSATSPSSMYNRTYTFHVRTSDDLIYERSGSHTYGRYSKTLSLHLAVPKTWPEGENSIPANESIGTSITDATTKFADIHINTDIHGSCPMHLYDSSIRTQVLIRLNKSSMCRYGAKG